MPDRLAEAIANYREQLGHALLFALIGVAIALGQILNSNEPMTWRLVLGRGLSTGGLAMAAGAILVWVPDVPLLAQIGIAAALASLGTSGLERLFQRALEGRS